MLVTVSVTVEVSSTRIDEMEQACRSAAREAGRTALEALIDHTERRRCGKRRRGTRRRQVLTSMGFVTIERGRGRRRDGTHWFPLDEMLGLPAHHEVTPTVRSRGTELAATHPYREAARLLSAEIGVDVDHRALWRWVQSDGQRVLDERHRSVEAMFTLGEAPPVGAAVPEALTVAVDATGIRLTDGTTGSVKLAVGFTASSQGPGGRRTLDRRHIVADICESDPFGQMLAYELERVYGSHRVPRLMLLGDGEPWISALGDDWLPTARYQCDWWHVAKRVKELCRSDPRAFRRLRRRAFSRPDRLARDLQAGRIVADPHEAELLAGYLAANGPHLHTYRRMGPGHWLHGSGPVEKHVELQIGRRFKRRGMRWSRPGARRLLAIRTEVVSNR